MPKSPLTEAMELVHADRGAAYGHPRDDFARTGRLMGAVLERYVATAKPGDPVPPETVGLLMVCVKLSRETNLHKRDNLTDMAGYVETVAIIQGDSEIEPYRDLTDDEFRDAVARALSPHR